MISLDFDSPQTIIPIGECTYVLCKHAGVQLLAYSESNGPYYLKAGGIPVGAFGVTFINEVMTGVDEAGTEQQTEALKYATMAFDVISQQIADCNDPAEIREICRRACREANQDYQSYSPLHPDIEGLHFKKKYESRCGTNNASLALPTAWAPQQASGFYLALLACCLF